MARSIIHKNQPKQGKTSATLSALPSLPKGEFTQTITGFSTDGRGILHHQGNTVFVEGALLSEEVNFTYTAYQKGHAVGLLQSINQASPHRTTPLCQYYQNCGGCSLQHLDFSAQLEIKQQQLQHLLAKQTKMNASSLLSSLSDQPWGYRRRARIGVSFDRQTNSHVLGFRQKYSNQITNIQHCKVLNPALSVLLMPLQQLFNVLSKSNMVSHIDMMAADNGVFVSLRHTKPFTDIDNEKLIEFAQNHQTNLYLQSEKAGEIRSLNHNKVPFYSLEVADKTLQLQFQPSHFIQVNREVNKQMVAQAITWLALDKTDVVLDLFAGLGNFSLPMAVYTKQVIGVEGSKALVDWANLNAQNNQLDNVQFYQANLNEDISMMRWRKQYQYNKVIIDPPRDGAKAIVPLIAKQIKPIQVLYISCHPATLARDLADFKQAGYQVSKASSIAMFPQTAHSESMVLLDKK